MKKLLPAIVVLVISQLLSCSKDKTPSETENVLLLDSTESIGSVNPAYKYVYQNNQVAEIKRYFLDNPNYPEKYIGKVIHVYENSKVIEKRKFFFPIGNILTEIQYYRYDSKGQLSQIERFQTSNGSSQIIDFVFDTGKLMKAKMFGDSIEFQYDKDDNIKKAVHRFREYEYKTINKPNPFLKGQHFFNDYELSNSILYLDLKHFPVYFNKYIVQEINEIPSLPYPFFRYDIETNPEGYLTKYKITQFKESWGTVSSYWIAEYSCYYK